MAEQQREAEQRTADAYAQNQSESEDEFPRIVRSRFRG